MPGTMLMSCSMVLLSQRITGLLVPVANGNQSRKKPAGIFTEAEVWVAVQQIYRLCMRVFISMAAFDF